MNKNMVMGPKPRTTVLASAGLGDPSAFLIEGTERRPMHVTANLTIFVGASL
jgi:hypothetical protein